MTTQTPRTAGPNDVKSVELSALPDLGALGTGVDAASVLTTPEVVAATQGIEQHALDICKQPLI
jgi:hypothetical protein